MGFLSFSQLSNVCTSVITPDQAITMTVTPTPAFITEIATTGTFKIPDGSEVSTRPVRYWYVKYENMARRQTMISQGCVDTHKSLQTNNC